MDTKYTNLEEACKIANDGDLTDSQKAEQIRKLLSLGKPPFSNEKEFDTFFNDPNAELTL